MSFDKVERDESVSAGADATSAVGRGICKWTVWESSMPNCQDLLLYLIGVLSRDTNRGLRGVRMIEKRTDSPSLHV